jgi:hypothetical protein
VAWRDTPRVRSSETLLAGGVLLSQLSTASGSVTEEGDSEPDSSGLLTITPTMPPAATLIEYSSSVQEPFDEVGGIEVQAIEGNDAVSVVTRVMMIPYERGAEERRVPESKQPYGGGLLDDSRYAYLVGNPEKCLADSFDSFDEIDEDSSEARLIKSIAEKATSTVMPYNLNTGLGEPLVDPQDPYFLDETEAKYLDVLDRHLEETDPETMSFAYLESGPDDPHPKKNRGNVDDIIEHFLDSPCCECTQINPKPLKSALKPSRGTFSGGSQKTSVNGDFARSSSVRFKDVDIREFKMTLGNHPSATSGPPVMLDWDSESEPKLTGLEAYERGREPRRNRRQLKLSLQQRHVILVKERGFSFEEVKGAWQEALNVRKQRKETLERGLALMKWDEVWESTCRKFTRIVDGSV